MKRIIVALLALLMVGSVTAYGATLEPVITLEPPVEKPEELMELPQLALDDGVSTFTAGKGGTYYVMLDPTVDYKKITVSDEGCIEAKLFKYDPRKHVALEGLKYCVLLGDTVIEGGLTFEAAEVKIEELTKENEDGRYEIAYDNCWANVIEIKVEDNYTNTYKEGKVKLIAQLDKKTVGAEIKVISDVFAYTLRNVEYAADYGSILDEMYYGVSSYDDETVGAPSVITKQAFRRVAGEKLTVQNGGVEIVFDKIGEGQTALNLKAFVTIQPKTEKKDRELAFGYYNNKQVSYSDFTITPDLDMTYFELREFFGVKLEEQDVVVYKFYKNGVFFDELIVDYADIDPNDEVVVELKGKAGDQLGSYYVTAGYEVEPEVETPELNSGTEESNPNTGAPTFFEWLLGLIFS